MASKPMTIAQNGNSRDHTPGGNDFEHRYSLEEHPPISSPVIIGVSGGTASGKTSISKKIIRELPKQHVKLICMDSFYLPLPKDANAAEYNFDHPTAFDWDCFYQAISDLKAGKAVDVPIYSFITHSRTGEYEHIEAADVVIAEGILVFYEERIRDLIDMRIFVDEEADTRLIRRVRRDIAHRGRSLESVLTQYEKFVKPMFDQHILPTKKFADVVLPRGASNLIAIDLMVKHIRTILSDRIRKEFDPRKPKLKGGNSDLYSTCSL